MPRLRFAQASDLDAFYAISLATGHAGGDATHLYEDRMLMGHIYSAPYAHLQPDLALVVEDDAGVGGFAVGAIETATWEARLERDWWPHLRSRYPDPGEPSSAWTADQKRWAMIHHPELTPATVAKSYPAHLHLNLLPRLQNQGHGAMLAQAWLQIAKEKRANAVHVGVNRINVRAVRFWARCGFEPLTADDGMQRTVWMGGLLTSGQG
jgi:GNAT superfamily N-acetyltransferase